MFKVKDNTVGIFGYFYWFSFNFGATNSG